MKKLTRSEWDKKYNAGPVKRFDQKYTVMNRFDWDPEVKKVLRGVSLIGTGKVKQQAGYTLEELALRWASRRGTVLELLNVSKPNPSAVSKAIQTTIEASNPRMQPMVFKPPEGVTIDVSDPQRITRNIKKVAVYFGADLVGVCRLDKRWVYSHTYEGENPYSTGDSEVVMGKSKPQEIPEEFQYAVVMGFEEEYDMIKFFPSYIDNAAASMGYSRMAFANLLLSTFIRNLGYKAIDCTTNDVAINIPMAMQAGLGELGRSGLLITPQFGPRVRISKVITDLPLVADAPIEFGVTEFCSVCKKCARMCPPQAIIFGERTVEPNNISNAAGALKWPINAEKCRIYWARIGKSCTNCIASCPYNKPYTWFHRFVRWCTDHTRRADPFYVKMDDLFGFGKPKKPDNFWEEWQPKRHIKS